MHTPTRTVLPYSVHTYEVAPSDESRSVLGNVVCGKRQGRHRLTASDCGCGECHAFFRSSARDVGGDHSYGTTAVAASANALDLARTGRSDRTSSGETTANRPRTEKGSDSLNAR